MTVMLLMRLGGATSLRLAVHYGQLYLPTLAKYHAKVDFPTKLFESLSAIAETKEVEEDWRSALPQWPSRYRIPGGPGYTNALETLWRMPNTINDPLKTAELATEAISRILMSMLEEFWNSRHLELWLKWIDGKATTEEEVKVFDDFWTDPDVAKRDTSQWLRLADEIETHFQSAETDPDEPANT
jgi:hypothetical protein